jgi:integrase
MVGRLKGSNSGEHPLTEQDKRFLGPLREPGLRPAEPGVRDGASRVPPNALSETVARTRFAETHSHILRHACGFDLVGRADYKPAAFMGHKRLENTARYSRLAPEQFGGLRP